MSVGQWPDRDTRLRIASIFRDHGVDANIYLSTQADPTEAVFIVESSLDDLLETRLSQALTDELRRKVWVVSYEEHWKDLIEPLLPHA